MRLSLRILLRVQATIWAARLVAVYRAELVSVLAEQDLGAAESDDEIDAPIAALDARQTNLRRRARGKDFSEIEPHVMAAANSLRIVLTTPLTADLGRRATDLVRDLLALEAEVRVAGPLVGVWLRRSATSHA